ncbi:MAG: DUF4129 domain-containing protein [Flectobacillus sp.]|uniref:DUF4129 domain-containing protein n=1 Tax=Flectobacillus sp. TaxID=50419 RepID=UPI003B9D62C8
MSNKKKHLRNIIYGVILSLWVTLIPIARLEGQISRVDTVTQFGSVKYPDETLNKLRKEKKYQYQPAPITEMSLADRLWLSILKWFMGLFDQTATGKTMKIGMYIFVAIVLIFAIMKLIGIEFANIFGRKDQALSIDYQILEQDIHALDFDTSIEEALSNQQYRLAIRLYYLQVLKGLSNQELIEWRLNKTNRSYIYELKSPELRQEFESLTTLFEYIWYGDFLISTTEFESIQNQFSNFNRSITRSRH